MSPQGAQYLQLLVEVPHHHDELQLGGAVLEDAALPGLLAFQVVPLDPPQQLKQGRHGHNSAAHSTKSAMVLPDTHWLPSSRMRGASNAHTHPSHIMVLDNSSHCRAERLIRFLGSQAQKAEQMRICSIDSNQAAL